MAKSFRNVTIANGASLSDAVDISGYAVIGIIMPSGWTTAGLTFQASMDGSNYGNLFDSTGAEVQLTVAAGYSVPVSSGNFNPANFLKLRSGTSATPVNQGAARTIQLVLES